MKKILLASVAAIAAAPAMAYDVNAALETALEAIDSAYNAVGGAATADTQADLASLLYMVDNHGAVSNINYDDATFDASGNFVMGSITVSTHDFSSQISTATGEVSAEIKEDLFGSRTGSRTDIGLSEVNDVWSTTGVGGQVDSWLNRADGLVADLNALETAIDGAMTASFEAGSLRLVDDASDALQTEGAAVNAALGTIDTGLAAAGGIGGTDYSDAIRTVAEANVEISNAETVGGAAQTMWRSHLDAMSTFDVTRSGTTTTYGSAAVMDDPSTPADESAPAVGGYRSYVDSFLDAAD